MKNTNNKFDVFPIESLGKADVLASTLEKNMIYMKNTAKIVMQNTPTIIPAGCF